MARAEKTGVIDGVTYTVKQESRSGQAQRQILYNEMVVKLDDKARVRIVDVETYVKMASASCTVHGLETLDGQPFDLPPANADVDEHMKAFALFMETSATIGEAISADFELVNRPTAPRHILPRQQLTEAELSNPDFLAGGNANSAD